MQRAGSLEAAAGDRFWPLVFGLYFLFQTFWRWSIGGALGLDEAQMMLNGQRLAWGYGSQPPLYGWLQWAAFRIVPEPLLAMALLKNALLAGTFLAVYRLLRSAHPPKVAGLATASLMLVPQFAWESQRALTHSVLATTLAAVATLVFWTRVLPRRRGADLLFGAAVGLGLIAKANFVFVAPALWLAAASLAPLRAKLRLAGVAASLVVAAAVCAGPLLWVVQHPDLALGSADKLEFDRELPAAVAAGRGLAAFAVAVGGFLVVPAVVLGLFGWCFRRPGVAPAPGMLERVLVRVMAVGLGLALLAVLASGSTDARDRWLQPVLLFAAPVATLRLLPRVTEAGGRWLGRVAAGLAVLAAAALPFALTGAPGRAARGGAPVAALADEIAARYPEAGRVFTDSEWLGGNLLYLRPGWRVERAATATVAPGEAGLLVVEGRKTPEALAAAIAARAGREVELGETATVALPYPRAPEESLVVRMTPLAVGP
jgi:4-amino-4-deoxy-L-arabinose transferase-like glycosyltransferase